MLICQKCKESFPHRVWIDGKLRVINRRKYCLECSPFGEHNTRQIELKRPKDKEKYRRWQQKARIERKSKLVALLGGKCKKCGYDKCPAAFDFHHIDPETKKFSISTQGLCRKWNDLVEEAMKCDLLCCRCHREIENNWTG